MVQRWDEFASPTTTPFAAVRLVSRVRIRKTMLALDGSPLAEAAIPYSVAISRAFGCPLVLVRVVDGRRGGDGHRGLDALAWQAERREALEYLEVARARLGRECTVVHVSLAEGEPAEQILELAARNDVDLIVMTSHGQGGASPWRLSSTAHKVLSRADTSILLVPVGAGAVAGDADGGDRPRRILVPLDCSQRAECVLPLVLRLAAQRGAEVVLAHAAPSPELPRVMTPSPGDLRLAEALEKRNLFEARRYLASVSRRLAAGGVAAETRAVVSRRAARTLLDVADEERADLVVISAHGRTCDPDDVYGGVTARLLEASRVPVLVVRDLRCTPTDLLLAPVRTRLRIDS